MKILKKMFSVLISISLIAGIFSLSDFTVFAKAEKHSSELNVIDGYKSVPLPASNFSEPIFDYIENNYSDVLDTINNGYSEQDEQIYLYNFKITEDELYNIVVYLENYYLNYFVDMYYSYSTDGTYIVNFMPKYTMTPDKVSQYNAQIEATVNSVVKSASTLKTDIEKIMYVHNYIVDTFNYDYYDTVDQNNIYGGLVLHNTMCVGYATSFNYIISKLGIKSYIITSAELGHAWNMVYLDGNYYHVDCTWDDPVIENANLISKPVSGYGYYSNMMCSDSLLIKNGHDSTDWDLNGYNAYGYADSAVYDDFFWQSYEYLTRYSDGLWYHNRENTNVSTKNDIKFFIDSIRFISNTEYVIDTARTINSIWSFGNSYYTVFYSTLQNIDDSVYYMTSSGIYKFVPGGKADGSDDILIFKNPRNDNIYDFDIDAEKGVFTVLYGKTMDNTAENAVTITYNISDYFCLVEGHKYCITEQREITRDTDGLIVYTCSACKNSYRETVYCYETMKGFIQTAINSKSGSSSFNAAVDYNYDGVINARDFHLLRIKYAEYL